MLYKADVDDYDYQENTRCLSIYVVFLHITLEIYSKVKIDIIITSIIAQG